MYLIKLIYIFLYYILSVRLVLVYKPTFLLLAFMHNFLKFYFFYLFFKYKYTLISTFSATKKKKKSVKN